MQKWLVNGEPGQTVSVSDRGLAYGDGLFETIAVRNRRCRFLDEHLSRLSLGLARLGIPAPDPDRLRDEAADLAASCQRGALKLMVTRGAGPRGYAAADGTEPTRILGVADSAEHSAAYSRLGVRARICTTPIGRNPSLAGLKTLNRLEQVLARAEWQGSSDIQEGLMLDDRGHVICGTMTNLFIVSDGVLRTPDLSEAGVAGIMRSKIIEQAARTGIDLQLDELTKPDLEIAEEIFLSNSQIGVWPIANLDGQIFARGAVTQTIMQQLAGIGVEECAD